MVRFRAAAPFRTLKPQALSGFAPGILDVFRPKYLGVVWWSQELRICMGFCRLTIHPFLGSGFAKPQKSPSSSSPIL